MWREADEREWLQQAIDFTGDTKLYGWWMRKVTREWPVSCEHNLTCVNMNRQAWVGHAACCLAIGCPEQITRRAWARLTEDQRVRANRKAQRAIELWEAAYNPRKRQQLPFRDDSEAVTFEQKVRRSARVWEARGYPGGIPDEADAYLESWDKVPSYRRICLAILRNDMTLKTLGFAQSKCAAYMELKRVEIEARR